MKKEEVSISILVNDINDNILENIKEKASADIDIFINKLKDANVFE